MGAMQEGQELEDPRLRVARRIAAVVGGVVVLIFAVSGGFTYIYCTTHRPVKEFFQAEPGHGPAREATKP